MGRNTLTYEYIDDDYYVILDGETIARIIYYGGNNFMVIWEKCGTRIPENGIDSAKLYVETNYRNFI